MKVKIPEKIDITDFPRLIKHTRKEMGESQIIFGARFGLPHNSISYYELGIYEAPYRVLVFCIDRLNNLQAKEK